MSQVRGYLYTAGVYFILTRLQFTQMSFDAVISHSELPPPAPTIPNPKVNPNTNPRPDRTLAAIGAGGLFTV